MQKFVRFCCFHRVAPSPWLTLGGVLLLATWLACGWAMGKTLLPTKARPVLPRTKTKPARPERQVPPRPVRRAPVVRTPKGAKAPAPRSAPVVRRAAPRTKPKSRAKTRRVKATAHVQGLLARFLAVRKAQPKEARPKPFPAKEAARWRALLGAIEASRALLPPTLLQSLRTALEHEGDRDRNRFSGMPAKLSNRIIKCMIVLGVQIGLYQRARPPARARTAPKKKAAKKVPNPSDLPPLVFTQKYLDRFKSATKLAWPIKGGQIGSGFGWRRDPFTRKRSFHGAADIGAPYNSPVYAAETGVVVRTGWMGSCGQGVVLQHSPKLRTYYCHLAQILAPSGKVVKRGQMIGRVGSTGRSTSPHLHFVVSLNGRSVNPADYLK